MFQLGGLFRRLARRAPAGLPALLTLLAAGLLAVEPASAQSFRKVIDRKFPVFFYCPIDPTLTLTFTAAGPEAILSVAADNFTGPSWNAQVVDNLAVVPQSVFQAHQVVTPGYETCYDRPVGNPPTPGYDFAAGAPEAYLNLFDTGAAGWDLGAYAFYNNSSSAPRDPAAGADTGGGGLALGNTDDGAVRATASTLVTGLVPGTTYVVTGWWYTQNLTPLEIGIDFNVPKTLSLAGASFTAYDSTTDFPDHSSGLLTGGSNFTAPLPLRHGATLLDLTLVGQVIAQFESITAQIRRVDTSFFGVGNPQTVATVTLGDFTPTSVETRSVAIPSVPIDLDHYFYYVNIQQGGGGVTHGVRVRYKDPDMAGPQSIGIAGLGFDAERNGTDVKWGNLGVMLSGTPAGTGAGHYVAPVRLPDGANVTGFSVTAFDEVSASATVRLLRVPLAAPVAQTMATVTTTGTSGDPVRTYSTTAIAPSLVDNAASYYYVDVSMGRVLDIYGVRITFTLPASPPAGVADAVAAVPFLPEQTTDQRQPFQGTLAGQYRFNTGLQLPDGAQVLSVSMSVVDNSDDGDMTAYLYRTDSVNSGVGQELMATLESRGAAGGVRTVATDVIRLGRVIDNVHYFYYAQFWTGFEPVTALGFTVSTAPCGDHDGDGFNGCVNDCNDNRAATRPGAPEICDGQVNNCSASFWPDPIGTIEGDDDSDGFSECQGDCNDANSSRWSPPSEPRDLTLTHSLGTGVTTLTWTAPLDSGSTTAPVYDTLRSTSRSDFVSGVAACVESNGTDLTSTMTGATPVGGCFYFLIRAEGVCGAGIAGHTSAGASISARNCP
jgi:hypothetical protein